MMTYSVAVQITNQMKSETNAMQLHICTSETASLSVILYGEKQINLGKNIENTMLNLSALPDFF